WEVGWSRSRAEANGLRYSTRLVNWHSSCGRTSCHRFLTWPPAFFAPQLEWLPPKKMYRTLKRSVASLDIRRGLPPSLFPQTDDSSFLGATTPPYGFGTSQAGKNSADFAGIESQLGAWRSCPVANKLCPDARMAACDFGTSIAAKKCVDTHPRT